MRIPIASIIDDLIDAVETARVAAAGDARWLNALNTGYDWLLQQDHITFDISTHELILTSPESGKTYRANGVCQCDAFKQRNACWHRGCARLVRRALEIGERRRIAAQRERVYAEVMELWT